MAEVTVWLKNRGPDAYKPESYGKTIQISRKFTEKGSSSMKIRSGSGQLISTKRDELESICSHFQIQVDNELTVLTQGISVSTSSMPFLTPSFRHREEIFGLIPARNEVSGRSHPSCRKAMLTSTLALPTRNSSRKTGRRVPTLRRRPSTHFSHRRAEEVRISRLGRSFYIRIKPV